MVILLFWVALGLPASVNLISIFIQMDPISLVENRALTRSLSVPKSLDELLKFPSHVDQYVGDNLGFRHLFIRTNNYLVYQLFGESANSQLFMAPGGFVDLANHAGLPPMSLVLESIGYRKRPDDVKTEANFLCSMEGLFRKFGSRLLIVNIPTKYQLYWTALPAYLRQMSQFSVPLSELVYRATPPEFRNKFLVSGFEVASGLNRQGYDLIPWTSFHWVPGPFSVSVTKTIALRFGLPYTDVPQAAFEKEIVPSDVGGLLPGVTLQSNVISLPEKYLNDRGIRWGIAREMEPNIYSDLPSKYDICSRFVVGGLDSSCRVFLISDSFGNAIYKQLGLVFDRAWFLETNFLSPLTKSEQNFLFEYIFSKFKPTHYICLSNVNWVVPADILNLFASFEARTTR